MTLETLGRAEDANENPSHPGPIPFPYTGRLAGEGDMVELSPSLLAELLDFEAWGGILTTYGRTMGVAVALTDAQGCLLGEPQNAQPVWKLIHDAAGGWTGRCPFCVTSHAPCTAVAEALHSGGAVMARDQAGLTHVAVPLLLGRQPLGAIIAGQVFDRYPEPLPLRRVAKDFDVAPQELWDLARKQRPVSRASLRASGNLLCALGHAFLQQRYAAILETRLAESNGRFRLMVEGVRDHALFTMDPVGRVSSWNRGAEHLLGYAEAEIVGQSFACIYTPEDIHNRVPESQLHQAMQAGRAQDEGWRVPAKRKQFWADVNITALLGEGGEIRSFAIIMQDVTERRRIAALLEETRLERGRLQEEFISHVSHELRTPLTAIYFFITNLFDGLLGDLTPEQHATLALAVDNIKQLKDMVSDLLDITRVETHKLSVEPQYASPVKLITEVLSTCGKNAALKNIKLRSDMRTGLPFIWADPARVRQVLINLIDNGIKFSRPGGIVTVGSKPFPENHGFLCLAVSDTGCGISPEDREIVFDRLTQLDNGAETSRGGLGLGLFISKELVLRHGGRIWVESELGHGSTFYFTLPMFSLAKLCAPIFTAPNLESGCVTLIAVDVVAVEEAIQADLLPEMRKILERCIHPGQDVLLPAMSDTEPVDSFFIVACAGDRGAPVIEGRIHRELQSFDRTAKLKPVISSTMLHVSPGASGEQLGEVAARIERLIHAHLLGKEKCQ
jgi:PAS domain S-box-containing protein